MAELARQRWRSGGAWAAAAASWRSERGRGGVTEEAGGRVFKAEDTGQQRQASHGAWRTRGGRTLLPVGHS